MVKLARCTVQVDIEFLRWGEAARNINHRPANAEPSRELGGTEQGYVSKSSGYYILTSALDRGW
jgi:hypothetical protein